MRRATSLAVRAIVVLLLGAAALDVPLPATSRARVRLHLIDFSDSVRVGPRRGLTPEDALQIARWEAERRLPGDRVEWAGFAGDFAFRSPPRDTGSTQLAAALEAALGHNPTEIVLHTDGRADPGRALLLCGARHVPVHVFPLGPAEVRDGRISRVVAPAEAAAGDEVTVEVTVEATFSGPLVVALGESEKKLTVEAGIPAVVPFTLRAPAAFTVRLIGLEDDCPQNDVARGEVFARSDRRKILALSAGQPSFPDFEVRVTSRYEDPRPYDAVIVDNVPLSAPEMRNLGDYVRGLGGGLLLLGGPRSYALGHWQGAPLETLSPLLALPPESLSVVFAIDASGSMEAPGRLDAVVRVVEDTIRTALREQDRWAAVAFTDDARVITDPADLRKIRAQGGTRLVRGIDEARRHLETLPPAKKLVFLLTDGETRDETPEQLKAAEARLRDIGLIVVGTNRNPGIGRFVKISAWEGLEPVMADLMATSLEHLRADPGPLLFDEPRHPAVAGLDSARPPRINRTTARRDAQVAARAGDSPAVAFRHEGRGRVGALAFGLDFSHPQLFRQAIEYVCGAAGGVRLSVDPPFVRARGRGPSRMEAFYLASPSGESGTITLDQVRSDVWEGTLPATRPGTVAVRLGAARATATIPTSVEHAAIGVDRAALERIASATGGRVLMSSGELSSLPRPETAGTRSGRPLFLILAGLFFLLEIAFSTFWKP